MERNFCILNLTIFILILLLAPLSIASQEEAEGSTMFWSTTLRMIRSKFPEVNQLSTDTLASWLNEPDEIKRPLIVDTRDLGEYDVSHLKGALQASTGDELHRILTGLVPGRRVVLYCSVGYRSSAMVRLLLKKGHTQIYNLEGSIFAWANEGRPVYQGDKKVDVVHPYDKIWGKLLLKPLRSR